jgi:hypothetical protein
MNKEKIMKGLECCRFGYFKDCSNCPYSRYNEPVDTVANCAATLINDAFYLMKKVLKEN